MTTPWATSAPTSNGSPIKEAQRPMRGTVKMINKDKGWGFIEPTDGGVDDAFFHRSAVEGCRFADLSEGQAVEYELTTGPKGLRAEHVQRALQPA